MVKRVSLCLVIMLIGMASAIEIGPAQAKSMNCYATPGLCQKALKWNHDARVDLGRALAQKFDYNVRYGLALTRVLFHVDLTGLAWCESTHNPAAKNGQYLGLTQQGDNFRSRPFAKSMYAFFSPYDPVANLLVAGQWIEQHGAGEWECGL